MLKIGLTGGIASGKSTICQLFSGYDIEIIDADIIAHQLVKSGQTCLDKIIDVFGKHVLLANGELDRAQMRELIFSDRNAKQQLEGILHPNIRQQLLKQSEDVLSPYCILSIPLLIEADMLSLVDRVLIVDVDEKKQIDRVCQRDNVSSTQAQAIINSQISAAQRKSIADDIIINNDSQDNLALKVANLHKKYLQLVNDQAIGCQ